MYEAVLLRLSKRVQQLRKNLGLTQAALASRAGVTTETVARLERVIRGRLPANANPSLETLARLSIALEVEPHELVASESVAESKNSQLGSLLDGASPAVTQRILRVAEVLLQEERERTRQAEKQPGRSDGEGEAESLRHNAYARVVH